MSKSCIWLGIVHKTEKNVYSTLSSPVYFTIIDVSLDNKESNSITSSVISINGHNNFTPIDHSKSLPPGDYIIGLSLEHTVSDTTIGTDSNSTTDKINGTLVTIKYESIDNLAMYQYISGLYRTIGYEPSVFLNQVAKSSSPSVALHRKIKSYLDELQGKLTSSRDDAGSEKLTSLKKEYDTLYEKLQEAENYIEELEADLAKPRSAK